MATLGDGSCICNFPIERGTDFSHFKASNAPIFEIFFFKSLKISRRFHFFALEHSQMKLKGRTVRTTASTTVCMNIAGVVRESLQHKTRNNPILK